MLPCRVVKGFGGWDRRFPGCVAEQFDVAAAQGIWLRGDRGKPAWPREKNIHVFLADGHYPRGKPRFKQRSVKGLDVSIAGPALGPSSGGRLIPERIKHLISSAESGGLKELGAGIRDQAAFSHIPLPARSC